MRQYVEVFYVDVVGRSIFLLMAAKVDVHKSVWLNSAKWIKSHIYYIILLGAVRNFSLN